MIFKSDGTRARRRFSGLLKIIAVCSISLFSMQIPALAWFDFGHMEVACIAYKRLTPVTRSRADALLKLNPYYSKWESSIPASCAPEDRNMFIFMLASTWPDAIKTDPAYHSDGAWNGHKADDPNAGQNIGYSDHAMHKYWHFMDAPLSSDGSPLPPVEKYNAQTQIAAFRKAIASNCNDDIKSYDLTWLIHLVGDVHQPLHCAMRFSKNDPAGDAGGNKVKLFAERGGLDNLHFFWDGLPGTDRKPDNVPAAAAKLHRADPQTAGITDENVWVSESFQYSKNRVYAGPIKNGYGPFRITSGYRHRALSLAKRRVELAGERLANLLNSELK